MMNPDIHTNPPREKLVYRSVSLTVNAFDHLKNYQRKQSALLNRQLDNSQALSMLIQEHKKINEESVEHRESHCS